MQPDVSIIIVNWNSHEVLAECLRSLAGGCEAVRSDVWVIDNASTRGNLDGLRKSFPAVHFVVNDQNVGFARANNQGALFTQGRYLLLLNPDTSIPSGAVSALVRYADEHEDIGVLGPRLLNKDGSLQRSCWRGYPGLISALVDGLYLWKAPWLPFVQWTEYRTEEIMNVREVDHVLGACMLIRREAWDDVGPLDEGYFLFLEETDWCLRARQKGWKVVYDPRVCVTHYGQHSMRQQPARNLSCLYRSYCRFYSKRRPGDSLSLLGLKAIIGVGATIRVGLWSLRSARASQVTVKEHGQRMADGYRQVLRELPSF